LKVGSVVEAISEGNSTGIHHAVQKNGVGCVVSESGVGDIETRRKTAWDRESIDGDFRKDHFLKSPSVRGPTLTK
jgi:hypothetical protein